MLYVINELYFLIRKYFWEIENQRPIYLSILRNRLSNPAFFCSTIHILIHYLAIGNINIANYIAFFIKLNLLDL